MAALICVVPVACTTEDDAPPATEEAPEPSLQGRKSTLGKAVDAAERTRERADEYNDAIERAADDLHQ